MVLAHWRGASLGAARRRRLVDSARWCPLFGEHLGRRCKVLAWRLLAAAGFVKRALELSFVGGKTAVCLGKGEHAEFSSMYMPLITGVRFQPDLRLLPYPRPVAIIATSAAVTANAQPLALRFCIYQLA